MKVICVKNKDFEHEFTIGNIYEATNCDKKTYDIIDNTKACHCWLNIWFTPLSEVINAVYINNKYNTDFLSICTTYNVVNNFDCYKVISDDSCNIQEFVSKDCFKTKTLSEIRNDKIDKLLE
jgi:hypothetical protein